MSCLDLLEQARGGAELLPNLPGPLFAANVRLPQPNGLENPLTDVLDFLRPSEDVGLPLPDLPEP